MSDSPKQRPVPRPPAVLKRPLGWDKYGICPTCRHDLCVVWTWVEEAWNGRPTGVLAEYACACQERRPR